MCNLAKLHTNCNRGHIYSTNGSDITIIPQTREIAYDFNPAPISGLNGKMQEYPIHVNQNINADGHFTTAGGGFNENIALGTFMTTDSITEEGTCIHDNGFKPTNVDIPVELHIPQDSRLFNDETCPLDKMENSPEDILMDLRTLKEGGVTIAHLNINFLYNKFEGLKLLVQNKIDILVLSETKLDDTYTTNQFMIEGFTSPFRADRNAHGGGLFVYVRDDIPCKVLKNQKLPGNVEAIFIELKLKNRKWLLMGGYNPHKDSISYFLSHISKEIDAKMNNHENLILIGDFNAVNSDLGLTEFCEMYKLKNLITDPTCYKSQTNPSLIDVILTNRKRRFQYSQTIETGLSDHHKMIITVLKSEFKKKEPIQVNCRCYKHFDEILFRHDLSYALSNLTNTAGYEDFHKLYIDISNLHAPIKKKFVRGNNAPFMNKTLSKAIMHRSKLKNQFNNNPTEENKRIYHKQRNYCVNLLNKEKRKYYNDLDPVILEDNRKFWQRIKALFSDKQKSQPKDIILVENDITTSDKNEVAEKLNSFFIGAVEKLEIEPFLIEDTNIISTDYLEEINSKYENHPSIIKIKENVGNGNQFTFKDMTSLDFENEILKLDPKKANLQNDIPTKMLIKTYDIISNYLSEYYNKAKQEHRYPTSLKMDEKTLAKIYRPVSLIPVVSKLFERNMYIEIICFIEKSLSPFLFGFRKGHSTQQCLIVMLEAWKKALDDNKCAGAILTDLSKAFDCLNHDLLIATLNAYGFSHEALKFIRSYLKDYYYYY